MPSESVRVGVFSLAIIALEGDTILPLFFSWCVMWVASNHKRSWCFACNSTGIQLIRAIQAEKKILIRYPWRGLFRLEMLFFGCSWCASGDWKPEGVFRQKGTQGAMVLTPGSVRGMHCWQTRLHKFGSKTIVSSSVSSVIRFLALVFRVASTGFNDARLIDPTLFYNFSRGCHLCSVLQLRLELLYLRTWR